MLVISLTFGVPETPTVNTKLLPGAKVLGFEDFGHR